MNQRSSANFCWNSLLFDAKGFSWRHFLGLNKTRQNTYLLFKDLKALRYTESNSSWTKQRSDSLCLWWWCHSRSFNLVFSSQLCLEWERLKLGCGGEYLIPPGCGTPSRPCWWGQDGCGGQRRGSGGSTQRAGGSCRAGLNPPFLYVRRRQSI